MIFTLMALMSTQASNFYLFLVTYSIGFGICNGLSYMVPVTHGWRWFPQNPGLVSGIIIGGFGVGQFTFSQVCAMIVNPDSVSCVNGKFPESVNERVPTMLLTLVTCNILTAILALCLIFPGPEKTDTPAKGIDKTSAKVSSSSDATIPTVK